MKTSSSSSIPSHNWQQVDLGAKLADLKQEHYHSVLTLSAMMELLIDKGILTMDELETKANAIDNKLQTLISGLSRPIS